MAPVLSVPWTANETETPPSQACVIATPGPARTARFRRRRITVASPPTNSRRGRSVGQGLVEYALVLALVGVLAIGATQYLGSQVSSAFASIGDQLSGLVTVGSGSQPATAPMPDPPESYTKKKTCQAAGYTWVTKPKPAHCT